MYGVPVLVQKSLLEILFCEIDFYSSILIWLLAKNTATNDYPQLITAAKYVLIRRHTL